MKKKILTARISKEVPKIKQTLMDVYGDSFCAIYRVENDQLFHAAYRTVSGELHVRRVALEEAWEILCNGQLALPLKNEEIPAVNEIINPK